MRYQDLRQPRRFDPREVNPLIVDTNRFNRNLMAEIMRTITVVNVELGRSESHAFQLMHEKRFTVIFLEWSELNEIDAVNFIKSLRRQHDDHTRRLPVIASSSSFTREQLIEGRNCGMDEFLKKPCSPNDVINRLKMVIETPRPFVDSKTYIGPCRRRKNPADYHGPRRRTDDDVNAIKSISTEERNMIDKESPVGASVGRIKMCCSLLIADPKVGLARTKHAFVGARRAASEASDQPFIRAMDSFEKYIKFAVTIGGFERRVLQTGISTLEQLAVLPIEFAGPRMTIAQAFEDAIERKLNVKEAS